MSDKKKILIIQPIHKAGIDLIKNNTNYDYEIIENIESGLNAFREIMETINGEE